MHLNEICEQAFTHAVEKGFNHPQIRELATKEFVMVKICLIHTEISEAAQEIQKHGTTIRSDEFAEELADAIIRIADLSVICGINLEQAVVDKMAFNKTRPFRHGKDM